MNSQSLPSTVLPLPRDQFRRFVLFFHAVFVIGLGVSLFLHWSRVRGGTGSKEWLLLGLVATQLVLYTFSFIIPTLTGKWPSMKVWGSMFGVSAVLWLIEVHVEPLFFTWAIGAYIGQILALSWRISVPISIVLCGSFVLDRMGWNALITLPPWAWFVGIGSMAAWIGLGLFLHRALATSSERAKLILELEEAKRQLELARQRDSELAVLRERERLARDLHDTLGHALVSLTVQLEAAKRLQIVDPTRSEHMIEEMLNLTRSTMSGLRQSLENLRAAGLGDRSLAGVLPELCAEVGKRAGLEIQCKLSGDLNSLPPSVSEVLWRVSQESLINIEKHARARRANVVLERDPKNVRLRISDDGIGLSAGTEPKPGHYGVRGMRERVEGLGGTFSLQSSGGTTVDVCIPVIQ